MLIAEELTELERACPGAKEMAEGGQAYIHLPKLMLPDGCQPEQLEALLCLSLHSGYATRLFLSQPVPNRGANWTIHSVFGRPWHSWSWNHVPANLRPMEILAEHLRGLQ